MRNQLISTLNQAMEIVSNVHSICVHIDTFNLARARMCLKEVLDEYGITITDDGRIELANYNIDKLIQGVEGQYHSNEEDWHFGWEWIGTRESMDDDAKWARQFIEYPIAMNRFWFWKDETDLAVSLEVWKKDEDPDFRIKVFVDGCNCGLNYWSTNGTGLFRLLGQNVPFDLDKFQDMEPIRIWWK